MAEEAFTESSFEELDIKSDIKRAVAEMGFEKMTPIQEKAIPALMTGRDIIGQAQTGTGKTAAFGIPVLNSIDPENKKLQAVILCPTRELAVQATGEIRNFAKYMQGVKLLPVYGGQDINAQIKGLKGTQIIVGTPGRVMDHMRRHTIKMDDVKIVVLDEADEMLDMGFREDMEVILGAIENEHQTCLFSATMPLPILEMTNLYQKEPVFVKITRKELTIDRIKQYYYPVKQEYKALALSRLIRYYNYSKCIVFCNTKGMVDELSASLQREGYTADGLHGDLTQKQRDSVMGRFRSGSVSILIATDIAARGIDVDDVEAVFNYDIPLESEYYVHRIGRTGRAGREGTSHTLCRTKEFRKIHDIEHICHCEMEEKRIPTAKEIRNRKLKSVLDDTLKAMNDTSETLTDMLEDYCEENCVSLAQFAATLLSKELRDSLVDDSIEVNVPLKSDRGDRNKRGFGGGDSSKRVFDKGDRKGHGEHRENKRDNKQYDKRNGDKKREDRKHDDKKRDDKIRDNKKREEKKREMTPESGKGIKEKQVGRDGRLKSAQKGGRKRPWQDAKKAPRQ